MSELTGPVEIVGAGLIGTSLGLALRRTGLEVLLTEPHADTLRTALSSGRTPFASLNATFAIADGLARSEDLRLVSDRIVGEGGGTLALARRQLDVALDINFNRPAGLPALGLRLQGPAESPQARFQTQAIQAHVARRAAEAQCPSGRAPARSGRSRWRSARCARSSRASARSGSCSSPASRTTCGTRSPR